MNDEIRKLLELQACDLAIVRLKDARQKARNLLERQRKEIEQATIALAKDTRESKALASHVGVLELELQTYEGRIAHLIEQQATATTNKEYAAFQKEIASGEADKSLVEDQLIDLYDKLDAFKEDRDSAQAGCEKQREEVARREQEWVAQEERTHEEVARLEAEKERHAREIDGEYLAQYRRVAGKVRGMVLAQVVRYNEKEDMYGCQGCHMKLPPQVVAETMGNKEPTHCPSCSRILYVDENKMATETA